jgi:flagellar hook-basal body complex protein FliE
VIVRPFVPDVPLPPASQASKPQPHGFAAALDDLGGVLGSAQRAEDAFAAGAGDLQTAIYERARADVALSVATAAAQRTAQALQMIFNMQV